MFEVTFNPIAMFYILLERYFDCASFGGSLARFQFVLAKICAFEGCLSFKHSFQVNKLVLHFVWSNLISQVYFYEVPRYCDNHVSFIILLNM